MLTIGKSTGVVRSLPETCYAGDQQFRSLLARPIEEPTNSALIDQSAYRVYSFVLVIMSVGIDIPPKQSLEIYFIYSYSSCHGVIRVKTSKFGQNVALK